MQTLPETTDRSKLTPPYVGVCPMYGEVFTVTEWRFHLIRGRFAMIWCPLCSDADLGVDCWHAVELITEASDDL